MFAMLVEINIKPEKQQEFLDLFKYHQHETSMEPGNIRFDVLQDPKNHSKFYAYEVYANEEALNAHRQTPHYKHCIKELEHLMTTPRKKTIFDWIYPE